MGAQAHLLPTWFGARNPETNGSDLLPSGYGSPTWSQALQQKLGAIVYHLTHCLTPSFDADASFNLRTRGQRAVVVVGRWGVMLFFAQKYGQAKPTQ